jgi:hypothetical protein
MGTKWKVETLGAEAFVASAPELVGSTGYTDTGSRTIVFHADHITEAVVRHELVHAYLSVSPITTQGMDSVDPHAVEEVVADLFAEYGPTLVRQARAIFKAMTK